MKQLKLFIHSLIIIVILATPVLAHSGRTDSEGGHFDRSSGGYHYHHGFPAHDHWDMDGDGDLDCPYYYVEPTYPPDSYSQNYESAYNETEYLYQHEEYEANHSSEISYNDRHHQDSTSNSTESISDSLVYIAIGCAVWGSLLLLVHIKKQRDKKSENHDSRLLPRVLGIVSIVILIILLLTLIVFSVTNLSTLVDTNEIANSLLTIFNAINPTIGTILIGFISFGILYLIIRIKDKISESRYKKGKNPNYIVPGLLISFFLIAFSTIAIIILSQFSVGYDHSAFATGDISKMIQYLGWTIFYWFIGAITVSGLLKNFPNDDETAVFMREVVFATTVATALIWYISSIIGII